MRRTGKIATLAATMALLIAQACEKGDGLKPLEPEYPYPEVYASLAGQTVMTRNRQGTPVINGGYGASMVAVPGEEGAFYLLTNRGPVAEGAVAGENVFIAKRFNPHIAKFKLAGDSMRLDRKINLTLAEGEATGLPNPPAESLPDAGTTNEIALDTLGRIIEPDPNGIDPGGLAAAADGSFWVSEEYGPSLLHFSSGGQLQEEFTPFETDPEKVALPKVFARRRHGGGMSGITIMPDGKTLACLMEAPLNNPDGVAGTASRNVRLLLFEPETGISTQYLYRLQGIQTVACEIKALDSTSFLVLERDNGLPGAASNPGRYKHIYRIDISEASDISDPENGEAGKMVNGKTLEQLSESELNAAGIQPVSRELLVDLLEEFPDYPHDKPDGLALIGTHKIAVINQDDYGIRSNDPPNGNYAPKVLPRTDETDRAAIWFIELPSPVLP